MAGRPPEPGPTSGGSGRQMITGTRFADAPGGSWPALVMVRRYVVGTRTGTTELLVVAYYALTPGSSFCATSAGDRGQLDVATWPRIWLRADSFVSCVLSQVRR